MALSTGLAAGVVCFLQIPVPAHPTNQSACESSFPLRVTLSYSMIGELALGPQSSYANQAWESDLRTPVALKTSEEQGDYINRIRRSLNLARAGHYDEALKCVEPSVQRSDSPHLDIFKARLLEQLGRKNEAIDALDRMEKHSVDRKIADLVGACHLSTKLGEWQMANQFLHQLIKEEQISYAHYRSPYVLYLQGLLDTHNGRHVDAIRTMLQAEQASAAVGDDKGKEACRSAIVSLQHNQASRQRIESLPLPSKCDESAGAALARLKNIEHLTKSEFEKVFGCSLQKTSYSDSKYKARFKPGGIKWITFELESEDKREDALEIRIDVDPRLCTLTRINLSTISTLPEKNIKWDLGSPYYLVASGAFNKRYKFEARFNRGGNQSLTELTISRPGSSERIASIMVDGDPIVPEFEAPNDYRKSWAHRMLSHNQHYWSRGYLELIKAQLIDKRLDQAEATLAEWKRTPATNDWRLNLAESHIQEYRNELPQAVDEMMLAISRRGQTDSKLGQRLASLLMKVGKNSEALDCLEKLSPKDPDVLLLKAKVLLAMDSSNCAEAIQLLSSSANLFERRALIESRDEALDLLNKLPQTPKQFNCEEQPAALISK